MKPECGWCIHYCLTSKLVTDGTLNVSGKPAKFRKWSKHKCALKQEDKYPRLCDFEENLELRDELDRRYPDLAAARLRIDSSAKKVADLLGKIK